MLHEEGHVAEWGVEGGCWSGASGGGNVVKGLAAEGKVGGRNVIHLYS